MTVIVSVETVLLVLLVVLVAGLLRSHAEILRRLGDAPGVPVVERPVSGVSASAVSGVSASAVSGVSAPAVSGVSAPAVIGVSAPAVIGATPAGDPVQLAFDRPGAPTLLAFLSSGCATCLAFWRSLAEPRLPRGVHTVIVTRGRERERPVRLAELAPDGIPVVMSSAAWDEYGVHGAPYFVLVDGTVRGEGVATSWTALASLVTDAVRDASEEVGGMPPPRGVDETLSAAGIGPGHPSLYPAGGEPGHPSVYPAGIGPGHAGPYPAAGE